MCAQVPKLEDEGRVLGEQDEEVIEHRHARDDAPAAGPADLDARVKPASLVRLTCSSHRC